MKKIIASLITLSFTSMQLLTASCVPGDLCCANRAVKHDNANTNKVSDSSTASKSESQHCHDEMSHNMDHAKSSKTKTQKNHTGNHQNVAQQPKKTECKDCGPQIFSCNCKDLQKKLLGKEVILKSHESYLLLKFNQTLDTWYLLITQVLSFRPETPPPRVFLLV